MNNNTTLVEALIDLGFCYGYTDRKGNNSLHIKASKGNVRIIKHLLAKPWVYVYTKNKTEKTYH